MEWIYVTEHFQIQGKPVSCQRYGNGHINDTYLVLCEKDNTVHRYILQRINTRIFQNTTHLMQNIENVTSFLRAGGDNPRSVLTLIPTKDGAPYLKEASGDWRMYDFVEGSLCLEQAESETDFYESAFAFGNFQRKLSRFDATSLHPIIPDFHNTPKRYRDFLQTVEEDSVGRVSQVLEEIAFLREREAFYPTLIEAEKRGDLPLRVTHNDTKINNVLLDAKTRKGLCVIDLDTVMPGWSVTDFGDSIRFGASTAAEDETDLTKVHFSPPLYAAYVKGFLAGCGGTLSEKEAMLLPEGAKMMTLECAMRFLADHLQGDVYFKTAYPDHNLVRFRTQKKLVLEMEENWEWMKETVKKELL